MPGALSRPLTFSQSLLLTLLGMPRPRAGPLHLYLTPELQESFRRYHASVNPHGSPSDTAREMIASQLGSDGAVAVHRAARETTRREVFRVANEVVRKALKSAADDFDSQMPEE